MLNRLVGALRSWFGYSTPVAEDDPEMLLQESIEERRNQFSRLVQTRNTSISTLQDLELERTKLELKESQLLGSIEGIPSEGETGETQQSTGSQASDLAQVRWELAVNAEQLIVARNAFESTQIVIQGIQSKFLADLKQSLMAIQELRKADVIRTAALALREIDTISSKADKYLKEIALRVADGQATLSLALGERNIDRIRTERKEQQQKILLEFEDEMGMHPDAARNPPSE